MAKQNENRKRESVSAGDALSASIGSVDVNWRHYLQVNAEDTRKRDQYDSAVSWQLDTND